MNSNSITYKSQSSLAHYCRTGEYIKIPGVNEKRLGRYRRLIFNVVKESLEAAYPLTRNLLETKEWENLAYDFFASHKCQSPFVWQMPRELFEFVSETNYSLLNKYPHLLDLLLFEWKEVEVFMMEDIELFPVRKDGVNVNDFVLNPEIEVLTLEFPVHLKNARTITESDQGHYFLSLHRQPETGRVVFTNIQYPHVQVIARMAKEPASFEELLKIFLRYADEKQARKSLQIFIDAALQSKLILG